MIFKFLNLIRKAQNLCFSVLLGTGFQKIGSGFYIEYPARIIGGEYMKIGDNFRVFGRLRLEAFDMHNNVPFNPAIIIGDNVSMNFNCHIGCINKIVIGDNVLIASNVFISDHSHGDATVESIAIPPSKRQLVSKGAVVIENNVWIGENVSILPNVTIGENSIIGANSVVTKNVPPNSIFAGVPAKNVKSII